MPDASFWNQALVGRSDGAATPFRSVATVCSNTVELILDIYIYIYIYIDIFNNEIFGSIDI